MKVRVNGERLWRRETDGTPRSVPVFILTGLVDRPEQVATVLRAALLSKGFCLFEYDQFAGTLSVGFPATNLDVCKWAVERFIRRLAAVDMEASPTNQIGIFIRTLTSATKECGVGG